jgi:hypothetical protein
MAYKMTPHDDPAGKRNGKNTNSIMKMQNSMKNVSLEGKYPTMSGADLSMEYGFKDLGGSTDYYVGGTKDEPVIMGEVDLEGGNVTGVYGSDPDFYGTGKHQRGK